MAAGRGAAERARRKQVRLAAAEMIEAGASDRKAKIAPVAPGHRCPRPPRGCRSA